MPRFLIFRNQLSEDQYLRHKYYDDPDACDLSEFMVVANVASGCKDIVTLFWDNKLGVDVDVCIIMPLLRLITSADIWFIFLISTTYRTIIGSSCLGNQNSWKVFKRH
jgi:hypothetical protein